VGGEVGFAVLATVDFISREIGVVGETHAFCAV
jgi:hypothetical protein